jgi:hypothetical protein
VTITNRLRLALTMLLVAACARAKSPTPPDSHGVPLVRPVALPGRATPASPATTSATAARIEPVLRLGGPFSPPLFSGDGAHVVSVRQQEGASVWIDGRKGAEYDAISDVVVAFDGAWVSFLAQNHEPTSTGTKFTHFLVHRGRETVLAAEGSELAVSADGRHVAVALSWDGGSSGAVELDGKRVATVVSPRLLKLSPDGRRVAFVEILSHRTTEERVHVDGKASKRLDAADGLAFSADSKHVAYAAWHAEGRAQVVVDGRPAKTYASTSDPLRFTSDGRVVFTAGTKAGVAVVIGTEEYGPYARVEQLAMEEDLVAWVAESVSRGKTTPQVFADGREIWRGATVEHGPLDDRGPATLGLVVSPRSGRVAFALWGPEPAPAMVFQRGKLVLETSGIPITFDATGDRLAVRHDLPDGGHRIDVVRVSDGKVLIAGPRFDLVHGETVRLARQGVRYFAERSQDGARELVRVEQGDESINTRDRRSHRPR